MPIIEIKELFSVIYKEVIYEIVRDDENLINNAIATAIDEAKLYLTRYDIKKLFGDDSTDPEIDSPILKKYCINIACWNIISLAVPNVSYEYIKAMYDRTIEQLKMIQKQQTQPSGWPYRDTTEQEAPQGSSVSFSSFPKRNNNF